MLDTPRPAFDPTVAAPVRTRRPVGVRLVRNIVPCLWSALLRGTIVLVLALGVPAVAVAGLLAYWRDADPPGSTLIWSQRLAGTTIDQRWVPLARVSPHLVRAVIASEDNQFCRHNGIDLREIEAVLEKAEMGEEPSRGGSTITMQVAKNLFLWSARSYARKALELPLALALEEMWPKDRIMEVYLNIAEWGPGVFGIEAAAQHHFRKPASRLTEREAALLAVALPNPALRVPSRPSPHVLKVASIVERRARLLGNRADCVPGTAPPPAPAHVPVPAPAPASGWRR